MSAVVSLRKVLSKAFLFAGKASEKIGRFIYLSAEERRVIPWFRDEGDRTLRLNYILNAKSMVLDLGGYRGQWASDIYAMYGCTIHVFEPVMQFAEDIRRRFEKNTKIYVHEFGLGDKNQTVSIHLAYDGSSIYRSGCNSVSARLVDAATFLESEGIKQIDLMKINIEGGEYDLLDSLIAAGLISQIRNIQVQFHDCIPEAALRMRQIQNALSHTHTLTYQYEFVWENWEAKQWQGKEHRDVASH